MSPSVPHRDLEQLMPSPRKTTLVSPVREALRFSSLPRTLEPLVDHMEVRKVGKSPTESQREKEPTASPVLPASNETDTPLPEKPTPGANTLRPCNDQFAATGPSLVVTASDVSPVSPLLPLDVRALMFWRDNNVHVCAVLSDDTYRIVEGARQ